MFQKQRNWSVNCCRVHKVERGLKFSNNNDKGCGGGERCRKRVIIKGGCMSFNNWKDKKAWQVLTSHRRCAGNGRWRLIATLESYDMIETSMDGIIYHHFNYCLWPQKLWHLLLCPLYVAYFLTCWVPFRLWAWPWCDATMLWFFTFFEFSILFLDYKKSV